MTRTGLLVLVAAAMFSGTASLAAEPAWVDLSSKVDAKSPVAGRWTARDKELNVEAGSGARIVVGLEPKGEYDFRVTFTRKSGIHSVALIVPMNGRQTVFDIDAWGQHLAGFQLVNGRALRERPDDAARVTLENGKKYTALVEVRKDSMRALIDGKEIAKYQGNGDNLSIVNEWRLPGKTASFGLGAWEAATTFHTIEFRQVSGETSVASTPAPNQPATTKTTAGTPKTTPGATTTPPAATATRPQPSTPSRSTNTPAAGAPVALIVIANQDFFYREYADPRQELERAGIRVEVAAAQKGACRPHGGSGQGPDGGVVQADHALADVKADRYAAILFAGGWGASQYQFAFRGRYNNAGYNGDPRLKQTANDLINAFVKQDKYVAGVCHGVSVLAWSRVDGKSLLDGKTTCAATRESPGGQHPGFNGTPASRWHAQVNNAKLLPGGSVGQPGNSRDDVAVDGKVLTGEDDASARELGRQLAQLIKG